MEARFKVAKNRSLSFYLNKYFTIPQALFFFAVRGNRLCRKQGKRQGHLFSPSERTYIPEVVSTKASIPCTLSCLGS